VKVESSRVYRVQTSSGRSARAVCVRCLSLPEAAASLRSPDADVVRALRTVVPEVAAGTVKVEAVGMVPELVCKVAVSSPEPDLNARLACSGQKGSRAKRLARILRVKTVDILAWNDDVEEMAISALKPMRSDAVRERIFDVETNELYLVVDPPVIAQAIGKNGANVRAARTLTGLRITLWPATSETRDGVTEEIERTPSLTQLPVGEEYSAVLAVLSECIPEISDGRVKVIAIGGVPGAVCKIAVASTDPNVRALAVCIGPHGERSQRVRSHLKGEFPGLSFLEWTADVHELVVRSLNRPGFSGGLFI